MLSAVDHLWTTRDHVLIKMNNIPLSLTDIKQEIQSELTMEPP